MKSKGFDASFVRRAILPDWWDDSLAENPANRALAESAIYRHLGFKIAQLRDPDAELTMPQVSNCRFKRQANSTVSAIQPALMTAQRAATLVLGSISDLPRKTDSLEAQTIRARILSTHQYVTLAALLDFCWENGIAVIHIDPKFLPKQGNKFQGIAMYCDETPVIVLANGKDSPAWIAFHLAHEIGHIMLEHVAAGDEPLVDLKIDNVDNEAHEIEANGYAA